MPPVARRSGNIAIRYSVAEIAEVASRFEIPFIFDIGSGSIADVTIIDPEKKVQIDESFVLSKCKNTPFIGKELYGSVEYTICNGNVVYSNK